MICGLLLFLFLMIEMFDYYLYSCQLNETRSVCHEFYTCRERMFQNNSVVMRLDDSVFLPRYVNKNRYLIYTCTKFPCGGWGDRRKGIIAAYLMALLSNRTFGIIHTFPADINEFLKPKAINWNIDPSRLKELRTKRLYTIDDIKFYKNISNFDFSSQLKEDVIEFIGNLDFVDEIRRHRDVDKAMPWLGAMTNADVYTKVWDVLFKPSDKLIKEMELFFRKKVQGKKLACAQIRLGKNPSMQEDETDDKFKIFFKIKDIGTVWKFFKSSVYSNYKIFIASDSKAVKKEAENLFPSQIVDTKGEITHMDRTKQNEHSGFEKAILEFAILSRCDTLVLTLSGFGIHAAYTRVNSNNLYCVLRDRIIPCSRETLKDIYKTYNI